MIRPMQAGDVDATIELAQVTFDELARSRGEALDPRQDVARVRPRYANLVRSDPAGAWVAERDGRLTGAAIALLREGVWGLSLLVVHPEHQSDGVGRGLLERAHEYAAAARGRVILSSPDPRALRAYARLGLVGHPGFAVTGTPRGVSAPAEVRAGTAADLPLVDDVTRRARGAAHRQDIETLLEMGSELLVLPERGYVLVREGGGVRELAALDDGGAQTLLRAVLARAPGHVLIEFITAAQAWAVPVCLEAGLELRLGSGAIFLGGDVGPYAPYLPSGAFL
jgi:GNAT superfamily N-acetyltransferase